MVSPVERKRQTGFVGGPVRNVAAWITLPGPSGIDQIVGDPANAPQPLRPGETTEDQHTIQVQGGEIRYREYWTYGYERQAQAYFVRSPRNRRPVPPVGIRADKVMIPDENDNPTGYFLNQRD